MSPYPHSFILTTTADLFPVRAPIYGVHLVFVTWQIHGKFSRPNIPDFQGCVFRSTDQETRISREAALVHGPNMATQRINEPVFALARRRKAQGMLVHTFRREHSRVSHDCQIQPTQYKHHLERT